MDDDDKRSSINEMHLDTPSTTEAPTGVGGRHKQSQPPVGVGGYLDICNISDFSFTATIRKVDPRLQELKDMGIGNTWLRIAEVVGFEAFMGIWMILGEDESIRIRMPPFSKYQRFQRNQLIKRMADEGLRREQIKKNIKKILCEDVSLRHIERICAKSKIKQ